MATNASNDTIMICALFILRDGCNAAAAAADGVVVIMTVLLLMFPFYCSRVECCSTVISISNCKQLISIALTFLTCTLHIANCKSAGVQRGAFSLKKWRCLGNQGGRLGKQGGDFTYWDDDPHSSSLLFIKKTLS